MKLSLESIQLLDRLQERSTWVTLFGLVIIVTGHNADLIPFLADRGVEIIGLGITILTLVGVLTPEKGKEE